MALPLLFSCADSIASAYFNVPNSELMVVPLAMVVQITPDNPAFLIAQGPRTCVASSK
jgi:hypothetical protein